ncbi:hypothetical protein ACPV5L_06690 [Vibrio astriarenae]
MKKLSLLSLSVAVALAGCGSDDDNNSSPEVSTKILTGFDGYFKNAVMFIDENNNGQLDIDSELILGLTNESGEVTVPEEDLSGVIALQTLTVGGDVQTQLASKDPKYAGVFTIDMDHPAQAMQHEVVFRAPQSSDVISPITDLVTLEMSNNEGMTQQEAEANVNEALGGTDEAPINLYADFVEGDEADAELHKTAQILTESKAANPEMYEDHAVDYAQTATDEVKEMEPEQIKDGNFKPVIESGSKDNFDPIVVTNNKLSVVLDAFDSVQQELAAIDIEVKGDPVAKQISIKGLFNDEDQPDYIAVAVFDEEESLRKNGLTVLVENDLLYVFVEDNSKLNAGSHSFVLEAQDLDSDLNVKGTVYTDKLTLTVHTQNQAPTVIQSEELRLQQNITNNWSFTQGEAVENTTLDVSQLFSDEDGDELEFDVELNGMAGVSASIEDALITLTGTPTTAEQTGTLTVLANDGNFAENTQVDFTLPIVAKGNDQGEQHPLEGNVWYLLERGSSDGDGNDSNNYTRVWCDSVHLKDGVWYFNSRTTDNRTQCSEPDYDNATPYEVIDGSIIATFQEDGESFELVLDKVADSDNLADGAVTVTWTEEGEGSRYVWFKDKADAEARIQIESQFNAEKRSFAMDLPSEKEIEYNTGYISVSLKEGADFSGSNELFDADITFDVPENNFNCATLREFYQEFYISGVNAKGSSFKSQSYFYMDSSFECFDNEENGVTYAGIDFDINEELVEGNVYSFIGKLKDDQAIFLEDIKFNVTWTGEGNNE